MFNKIRKFFKYLCCYKENNIFRYPEDLNNCNYRYYNSDCEISDNDYENTCYL